MLGYFFLVPTEQEFSFVSGLLIFSYVTSKGALVSNHWSTVRNTQGKTRQEKQKLGMIYTHATGSIKTFFESKKERKYRLEEIK